MSMMMKGMVKALPAEERKQLMLKMMPTMMKDVDLLKMIPNMLKKMGSEISLYNVFNFLSTLLKDEELKSKLENMHENMMQKMPEKMEQMQPMMEMVMSVLMPAMMKKMGPMMPMMAENMPKVMTKTMIPMFEKNPDMKDNILTMMQSVFPHCAQNLIPFIEKEQRNRFIKKLASILKNSLHKEEN